MLSYRHIFHAGNHADILKHITLCLLIRELNHKEKPYSFLDTHAGAGFYNLKSGNAQKTCEYKSGISKICENPLLKKLVPEYFSTIEKLKQAQGEDSYPGSPYFEQQLLRACDHLTLIDLHPTEFASLKEKFAHDQRINVQQRDGLQALSALLPPTPRRGLAFIDPAYEDQGDYYQLVKALKEGIKRWHTGLFAIWYPVLGKLKDHSKKLVADLKRLNLPLLQVELQVAKQSQEFGMNGSGLLILNYPFGFDELLNGVIGELYKSLSDENGSAKVKIINQRE